MSVPRKPPVPPPRGPSSASPFNSIDGIDLKKKSSGIELSKSKDKLLSEGVLSEENNLKASAESFLFKKRVTLLSKCKACPSIVSSWEYKSGRGYRCCWSCVTCCGKIDYHKRKHRVGVAVCCSLLFAFIIYSIVAVAGMLLTQNFTASVDHLELFPDQACGNSMPVLLVLNVNK
jgi:hypothetical protein